MWHEFHQALLAERWHWGPDAIEGMPISVRNRLVDSVVEIVSAEKRKLTQD